MGSLGDLHPFIAVGLALHAEGVDVVLACASEYGPKVEQAGLAFQPIRPSFDDMQRRLGLDRAQLTRAVLRRQDFLLKRLLLPTVREAYEDMLPVVDGASLVLTSSLSVGARLAAEKCSVPWLAIVLQPMMFLSAFDPPSLPGAEWLGPVLRRLGPGATGRLFGLLKRYLNSGCAPIHALRAAVGLPPTRLDPLFDGQFSAAGAIGLYSPLLGGVRQDYPRPCEVVGFAPFDSEAGDTAVLEPALQEFLARGPAPLVFTLGSLIVNSPGAFFRESVAAARALGMRAVLLVGEGPPEEFAASRDAGLYVCRYAPHSLLFPEAAVVTHQGGIGTLAQAMRSGRPQLVVPFYADQLDNAVRAERLGVARRLSPRHYTGRAAAQALGRLMSHEPYGARAAEIRERLAGEDGAARTARAVMDRLDSRAHP